MDSEVAPGGTGASGERRSGLQHISQSKLSITKLTVVKKSGEVEARESDDGRCVDVTNSVD